jgi:DNA-binding LacI/PurR family transcriptional regulator
MAGSGMEQSMTITGNEKPNARVTQKDVARRVGCSGKVVSQALRDDPRVSESTRTAVWKAAEELGYRRRGERSERLGVVANCLDHPYYSAVLQGMFEVAAGEGYVIDVRLTDSNILGERQAIADLDRSHVEGLILLSPRAPVVRLRSIVNWRRPIVAINITHDENLPGLACLASQNEEAAAAMTKELWNRGHRQFCYLSGPPDSQTNQMRLEGCRRALLELGAEPRDHLRLFDARGERPGPLAGALACEKLQRPLCLRCPPPTVQGRPQSARAVFRRRIRWPRTDPLHQSGVDNRCSPTG